MFVVLRPNVIDMKCAFVGETPGRLRHPHQGSCESTELTNSGVQCEPNFDCCHAPCPTLRLPMLAWPLEDDEEEDEEDFLKQRLQIRGRLSM